MLCECNAPCKASLAGRFDFGTDSRLPWPFEVFATECPVTFILLAVDRMEYILKFSLNGCLLDFPVNRRSSHSPYTYPGDAQSELSVLPVVMFKRMSPNECRLLGKRPQHLTVVGQSEVWGFYPSRRNKLQSCLHEARLDISA